MDLPTFRVKLRELAQATPDRSLVIKAAKTVPYDKLKAVLDCCADAKINVSVVVLPPALKPQPATPAPLVTAPVIAPVTPAPTPTPAPVPSTSTEPVATTPSTLATTPTEPTASAPTKTGPLRAVVRVDGKVNFKGATYELPGFKSKLQEIIKATPDQPIIVKAGKTVPFEKLKAVLDICDAAQVKYLSVVSAAPAPAPSAPSTANLPAPGLLMHPSMEPITSSTPAASNPTPENPPTTNAPPPSGP